MKKNITLLALAFLSLTLAFCTPKVGKEIAKTTDAFDLTAFTQEDLAQGHKLMTSSCSKCHKLYNPADYDAKTWDGILKSMIPKAKLQGRDADLVRAYILSQAKK